MDGSERKNVRPGLTVDIVLKQCQRMGRLTRGVVRDVLTKSSLHPYCIKVRLERIRRKKILTRRRGCRRSRATFGSPSATPP